MRAIERSSKPLNRGLLTIAIAAAGVTFVLVLALAPAAHAETVIAQVRDIDTPFSAFRGVVVSSTYDAAAKRYHLMAYRSGMAQTVRVRSSSQPFDPDLGPDGRGRLAVVYSRCRKHTRAYELVTRGPGCDLYRYTFATRQEQKLWRLSGRHSSEVLPTIWGNRVAFARLCDSCRGTAWFIPSLFVGDLRTGRVRKLEGGTRGHYGVDPDYHAVLGGPGPTSLDLRGDRIAYAWHYVPSRGCEDSETGFGEADELWLESLSGRHERVEGGCGIGPFSPVSLGATELSYPGYEPDPNHLDNPGDTSFYYRRFDLRRRQYSRAPLRALSATSDGATVYFLRNSGFEFAIVKSDPITFRPTGRTTPSGG